MGESERIFSGGGNWGSSQSYFAMPRAMSFARSNQNPSAPVVPAIAKLSNIEIPKLATGNNIFAPGTT